MLPQRVSRRQELAASSPPNAVASPPVAFDMASDLKQWIAPLLDTDLETIYNVLKRDFEENSMKDERKQWQDRIECKSTGFKIQYSHRRNVQLRHVDNISSSGVEARVCDLETQIRVTFTPAAVAKFEEVHKTKFGAHMEGHVIQLIDFEVLHASSFPDKIRINVTGFSEESGRGKRGMISGPMNINDHSGLKPRLPALLNKFQDLLSRGKVDKSWLPYTTFWSRITKARQQPSFGNREVFHSNASSPLRSQAGDIESDEDALPADAVATQAEFATQIATVKQSRSRTQVVPQTAYSNADLLNLLTANQSRPQSNNKNLPEVLVVDYHKDAPRIPREHVLQALPSHKIAKIAAKLDMRANTLPAKSVTSSKRDSLASISAPGCTKTSFDGDENSLGSDNSEKENSQGSTKNPNRQVPTEDPASLSSAVVLDCPEPAKTSTTSTHPFIGLTHVPRSHVRVQASQKALLDKADSWVPLATGGCPTLANIPNDILEQLRQFELRKLAQRQTSLSLDAAEDVAGGAHKSTLDQSPSVDNDKADEQSDFSSDDDDDDDESADNSYDIHYRKAVDNPGGSITLRTNSQGRSREFDSQSNELSQSALVGHSTPLNKSAAIPSRLASQSLRRKVIPETSMQHSEHDYEEVIDDGEVSWAETDPGEPFLNSPASQSPSITSQVPDEGLPRPSSAEPPQSAHHGSISRVNSTNFEFPTSSPNQEEFEMDIPHAIGEDIYEADAGVLDSQEISQETSQELPSTASHSRPFVQVQQTPFPNPRTHRVPTSNVIAVESTQNPRILQIHHESEYVSSDPIIPATFHDPKSQIDSPPSKERSSSSGHKSSENIHRDPAFLPGFVSASQTPNEIGRGSFSIGSTCVPQQSLQKTYSRGSPNAIAFSKRPHTPTQSPSPSISTTRAVNSSLVSSGGAVPRHQKRHVRVTMSPTKRRELIEDISQTEYSQKNTSELAREARRAFQAGLEPPQAQEQESMFEAPHPASPKPTSSFGTTRSLEIPDSFEEASSGPSVIEEGLTSKTQVSDLPKDDLPSPNDRILVEATQDIGPSSPAPDIIEISSAFDKFKAAYPSYLGNERIFTRALTYIEWLRGDNEAKKAFLPKSLWDDFIGTLADEYIEYVRKLRGSNQTIPTGLNFFNDQFTELRFTARMITPDTLDEAIASMDPAEVNDWRKKFRQNERRSSFSRNSLGSARSRNPFSNNSTPGLSGKRSNEQAPEVLEAPKKRSPSSKPHSQIFSARRKENQPVVIQVDETPQKSRQLPWLNSTPQVSSTRIPRSTEKIVEPTSRLSNVPSPTSAHSSSRRSVITRPHHHSSPILDGDSQKPCDVLSKPATHPSFTNKARDVISTDHTAAPRPKSRSCTPTQPPATAPGKRKRELQEEDADAGDSVSLNGASVGAAKPTVTSAKPGGKVKEETSGAKPKKKKKFNAEFIRRREENFRQRGIEPPSLGDYELTK